jgi:branched-chain amino acid transport system ATP-binding protein
LQIARLRSGYGNVQALWDVALEVMPGQIVALIGANGAGKTTLLRTISQLTRPWGGSIRFAGRELIHATSDEIVGAGIVHVPQGRRLFAGLTVKENLMQGAYLRADRRAVQSDLERVITLLPRLGERLGQLAGRMSGGEQQMCAIGRGLMSNPRLLMIDEMSLGLAPLVVDNLLTLIGEINRQGTTVLLVEQDVQVALEQAHRAYVLETGRIVKSGAAAELLDDSMIKQAYLGL